MSGGSDLRKLVRQLEAQGFDCQITRRGHVEVRQDGIRVATLSGTPSDRRSWMNGLAALKRAGFNPNQK